MGGKKLRLFQSVPIKESPDWNRFHQGKRYCYSFCSIVPMFIFIRSIKTIIKRKEGNKEQGSRDIVN